MRHAIVSGGAGFIGSHLCAALLEREYGVTCIDNLLTGSERNLKVAKQSSRFTFIEHDVSKPLDRGLEADLVFHLASPAAVPDYLDHPLETLAVNSRGTENMLNLALATGARFLYTSTSEVYGDPLVHPQPETYLGNVSSIGPRACYDESKRFGEALVMEYWRTCGVDARVVRIFNTYGPHSRPSDGRIVPNFVTQALRSQPLTIYGDGSQTRSFCYVSDMVRGLEAAMLSDGTAGEVFNLGNPDEYTVLDFANVVRREVGGEHPDYTFLPLPVDDPTRRCPDIGKARTILGLEPVVDVPEGMQRTIDWFQQTLELPSAAW
ncbi:MAG: NAD-dependent epimerase/dehydratase family protein [Chloroflexota bacterium]